MPIKAIREKGEKMRVKITAWVKGEYIFSEVLLKEKTLTDLLKQISTQNGKTLFELLIKKDGTGDEKYMIKINNARIDVNRKLDIPLNSDDHVVVTSKFQFAAGG